MDKRYTKAEIRKVCNNSNIHVTDHDIQVMVKLFAKPMTADEFIKNKFSEYVGEVNKKFYSFDVLDLMVNFAEYLGCENVEKY